MTATKAAIYTPPPETADYLRGAISACNELKAECEYVFGGDVPHVSSETIEQVLESYRARLRAAEATPALSAELRELRAELATAKAQIAEAEYDAGKWSEEWEKDCARALRQVADECDIDWEDGKTADDIYEHVKATMEACDEIQGDAAARDARMRREGAAEWLEEAVSGPQILLFENEAIAFMRAEAARLREGK